MLQGAGLRVPTGEQHSCPEPAAHDIDASMNTDYKPPHVINYHLSVWWHRMHMEGLRACTMLLHDAVMVVLL